MQLFNSALSSITGSTSTRVNAVVSGALVIITFSVLALSVHLLDLVINHGGVMM